MCHGITGDTLKKLVSQLQPSAYRWYQIVGNKELHSHRVSHFHHEWQIRSWCPAKTRLVSHMPIMSHTNTHCRYTYLSLMSYNLYRTICTPHSDSPRHLQVQIFVVSKIALHGKQLSHLQGITTNCRQIDLHLSFWNTPFFFISYIRAVSFYLETKTSEPNANRVSGVLIGSVNTQRTRGTYSFDVFF